MKNSIFFLIFLSFVSCGSDDPIVPAVEDIDFMAQNEQEITAYLRDNNLVALRSDSGLYYIINEQGNGEAPTNTSNVTVQYTGAFIDGVVFDQNLDPGISAGVSDFILGWQEGLQLLNEGGSGQLFIPAHLGYGSRNFGIIPAGSVLIFDITLVEVTQLN